MHGCGVQWKMQLCASILVTSVHVCKWYVACEIMWLMSTTSWCVVKVRA